MAKGKRRYAGPPVWKLTYEERKQSIERNGIQISDLKASFDDGYAKGRTSGMEWGYDAAWGSVMLALHREFGFGRDRLARLANATARVQVECITSEEAFRKIVDETGLTLPQFREVINEGGLD